MMIIVYDLLNDDGSVKCMTEQLVDYTHIPGEKRDWIHWAKEVLNIYGCNHGDIHQVNRVED